MDCLYVWEEKETRRSSVKFVTFIKPIPQNQKLSRGKGSRLYLNKDYVITWDAIGTQWRSQYHGEPIEGKTSVSIEFGWNRMDIDSCVKSILDTLQGIAYVNDKHVSKLSVIRIDEPEIRVTVEQL